MCIYAEYAKKKLIVIGSLLFTQGNSKNAVSKKEHLKTDRADWTYGTDRLRFRRL